MYHVFGSVRPVHPFLMPIEGEVVPVISWIPADLVFICESVAVPRSLESMISPIAESNLRFSQGVMVMKTLVEVGESTGNKVNIKLTPRRCYRICTPLLSHHCGNQSSV